MQMRMLGLVVLTAALFLGSVAEATNWKFVSETRNGVAFYVDVSSLKAVPPDAQEVWVKHQAKTPDCESDYAKEKNKCIVDGLSYYRLFREKSFCTLKIINHFTDGTHDGNDSYECEPRGIVPDSIMDSIWDMVYRLPKSM